MRKKLVQLIIAISFVFSFDVCAKSNIEVCAVPQTYSALENIRKYTKVHFETFYGSSEEILSIISNQNKRCHIIISEDEKIPVIILKSNKTEFSNIKRLVRAPLVLWSKDENVIDDKMEFLKKKKLKNLVLPKASLSTVGYAASEIIKQKDFPIEFLKGKIFRTDHEYSTFSLVDNENVQAGFVTKPVIMKDGKPVGSFYIFPYDKYEPIYYYVTLNNTEKSNRITTLYTELTTSVRVITSFILAGFDSLD
ncbi:MAG: substrate-binding domain-containing protein [Succinivibrio sp.]|nr:substrate-binding domain-containing protein [Succinivibrio sp.]